MKELMDTAYKAMDNSYSPYSGIKIGAAVLGKSGKVYTGTNIENSAYGSTICAERVAIFKAISEGEKEIKAIAITGNFEGYANPCGACRQVMSEFMDNEAIVIVGNQNINYNEYKIKEILPFLFTRNTKGKQK